MKLCKRSIIVSSLLAVLAISSAYAAAPVQSTENTDTAMAVSYTHLPHSSTLSRIPSSSEPIALSSFKFASLKQL